MLPLWLLLCWLPGCARYSGDVTVHALVKASRRTAAMLVRVPLRAMRDIQFPETRRLPGHREAFARSCRTPPGSGCGPSGDPRRVAVLAEPASRRRGFRWNPTAPTLTPLQKRSRTSRRQTARIWSGTRCFSMCCWSTRSIRTGRASSIRAGFTGWLRAWSPCCASTVPPGGAYLYALRDDPGSGLVDPRWFTVPAVSSNWAFATSWMGPTICCSCSAW